MSATETQRAEALGATTSLRSRRQALDTWPACAEAALGGMAWGGLSPQGAGQSASLEVPVLSAAGPQIDVWCAGNRLERGGEPGGLHWCDDGDWLWACLDLPVGATDLAEVSRQAYAQVFALLQERGGRHLLRLWNYLPRINADGGGLERYRQFNWGRSQAFIDAGMDGFEGAPAACALGKAGGGLSVRFLAGRSPPLPLDNPRQVPAYRYSPHFGPRSPTFSRAALAEVGEGQLLLLISGTASIVGERSLHEGDVEAQVDETLRNLQAVIEAAHARCTARFSVPELECVVYVRHPEDALKVRRTLEAALGADALAAQAVILQADICRAELLVEIEAQAFSPGHLRP
jgi:enamine deaminase RidA (YjgF/YER057c/UK114 family)